MSMIDESTHCVVENLALRHANAKQTLEQARSKEGFDPAALAELEGAEREAWNSWQAAQQLVQELREKTLADEGSMVRVSPKRGWSPATRRALLKLAKRYRDARRTLGQIARFVDSAVSEHGYKRHPNTRVTNINDQRDIGLQHKVTAAMVRRALHFCPLDLSSPEKWRWMAEHINKDLAAVQQGTAIS